MTAYYLHVVQLVALAGVSDIYIYIIIYIYIYSCSCLPGTHHLWQCRQG